MRTVSVALVLAAVAASASASMSVRMAAAIRAEAERFAIPMPANTTCPPGALALHKCLLQSVTTDANIQSLKVPRENLPMVWTAWRLSASDAAEMGAISRGASVGVLSSVALDDTKSLNRRMSIQILGADPTVGPSVEVAFVNVTVRAFLHVQHEEQNVRRCFACGSRDICCSWHTDITRRAFTEEELGRIQQGIQASIYSTIASRIQVPSSPSALRGLNW